MTLICPTCQQPMPGMDEPLDVGTVVSCTCGDGFVRHALKSKPSGSNIRVATGPWRKLGGGQTGGCAWLTVLAKHPEDGHTLTVVHRPAASSGCREAGLAE